MRTLGKPCWSLLDGPLSVDRKFYRSPWTGERARSTSAVAAASGLPSVVADLVVDLMGHAPPDDPADEACLFPDAALGGSSRVYLQCAPDAAAFFRTFPEALRFSNAGWLYRVSMDLSPDGERVVLSHVGEMEAYPHLSAAKTLHFESTTHSDVRWRRDLDGGHLRVQAALRLVGPALVGAGRTDWYNATPVLQHLSSPRWNPTGETQWLVNLARMLVAKPYVYATLPHSITLKAGPNVWLRVLKVTPAGLLKRLDELAREGSGLEVPLDGLALYEPTEACEDWMPELLQTEGDPLVSINLDHDGDKLEGSAPAAPMRDAGSLLAALGAHFGPGASLRDFPLVVGNAWCQCPVRLDCPPSSVERVARRALDEEYGRRVLENLRNQRNQAGFRADFTALPWGLEVDSARLPGFRGVAEPRVDPARPPKRPRL